MRDTIMATGSSLALATLDRIFSFLGFTPRRCGSKPLGSGRVAGRDSRVPEARGLHYRLPGGIPSGTAERVHCAPDPVIKGRPA